jgi:hypothetical protein
MPISGDNIIMEFIVSEYVYCFDSEWFMTEWVRGYVVRNLQGERPIGKLGKILGQF